MARRALPQLDAEALALFARKGHEGGPAIPQAGEANAVKVRRVIQLVQDLANAPFEALRILDLGCGEGAYAIEAAARGAEVVAVDARTERMRLGAACAERHHLTHLRFEQADVRSLNRARFGSFDVVLALGVLYHFDAPDVFHVLEEIRALCERLLVVDTFVSLADEPVAEWRGRAYRGQRVSEHEDADPPEVRRRRLLRSINNTFSIRFSRSSLTRLLHDVGFSSVLECHAPLEPHKPEDRITLAALPGERVRIATYPWINSCTEEEIDERLRLLAKRGGR